MPIESATMTRIILIITLLSAVSSSMLAQCIGTSGQISWHLWKDMQNDALGQLYVDDTYPNGPEAVWTLNALASPYNYDDHYASVMKGFISVPESGPVTFNLTGDDDVVFYLSSDATRAHLDTVAYINGWTGRTEHKKYPSQTSSVFNLLAGQYYYFEVHHTEGGGGDHSSVYWQRPYLSDTTWTLITSPYLTDVCDIVCSPKATPCDDGLVVTTNDITDGSCHCVGIADTTGLSLYVGKRGQLEAYFYDDLSGSNLSDLLTDSDWPGTPDRLIVHHEGLSAKWDGAINDYGTYIRGYLTVPVSGLYDFNVTGVNDVRFYLSSDGSPENKTAHMIETYWGTDWLEHDKPEFNGSQTVVNVSLEAGRYYYFEVLQVVKNWGDRFSVFWNAPYHQPGEWHRVPEMMVYDYTNEMACLPENTICDDGDPLTKGDRIVMNGNSCDCIGDPCTPFVDCDDPAAEFDKYDYCETTDNLGTRPDDAWMSCDPSANTFLPARSGYHWIHYDLGRIYQLKQSHIWNYNVPSETDKGFSQVVVDYSIDGINWIELDTFNWSQASGESSYTGFEGPHFQGMPARYVMFTSLDDPTSCRGISKATFIAEECPDKGKTCDDGNADTYNDHFTDDCICAGYTLAQLDCQIDTLFVNEEAIGPDNFHAMSALMSEGKVMTSANVHYKAGVEILLTNGFEVKIGGELTAQIDQCPESVIALAPYKVIAKNLKKLTRPEASMQLYSFDEQSIRTLRFYLPEATHVKIEVKNQEGETLYLLADHEYTNFGEYYKRIQTRKIPPGIYIITLKTNSYSLVEKMIIV